MWPGLTKFGILQLRVLCLGCSAVVQWCNSFFHDDRWALDGHLAAYFSFSWLLWKSVALDGTFCAGSIPNHHPFFAPVATSRELMWSLVKYSDIAAWSRSTFVMTVKRQLIFCIRKMHGGRWVAASFRYLQIFFLYIFECASSLCVTELCDFVARHVFAYCDTLYDFRSHYPSLRLNMAGIWIVVSKAGIEKAEPSNQGKE